MSIFEAIDAPEAVRIARRTLYSVAGTILAGHLLIWVLLRYGGPSGNGPSGSGPLGSGPSGSAGLIGLPAGDALFLLAVPAGLALLACAAGRWEKSLREKRRARARERLKEVAHEDVAHPES